MEMVMAMPRRATPPALSFYCRSRTCQEGEEEKGKGVDVATATATAFCPTPYRVSTITAVGCIGTSIDLDRFFMYADARADAGAAKPGDVVYMEYSPKRGELLCRGDVVQHHMSSARKRRKCRKQTVVVRPAAPAAAAARAYDGFSVSTIGRDGCSIHKHFDNQVTVVMRAAVDDGARTCDLNMKVFRNGNVQITGIKTVAQGSGAIDTLIAAVRGIITARGDPTIVGDAAALRNTGYRVCLINSDFHAGFEIKRDKLFSLLVRRYCVMCSYEPCIYPGVKVQYYWNQATGSTRDGVCRCSLPCDGRDRGDADGKCRKITIAVFQSGCIIITGAHTHEQVDDAYSFICSVLQHNEREVAKQLAPPPPMPTARGREAERSGLSE